MNTTSVKYPDVTVKLTGQDGNAFMIMGLVKRALKNAGASKAEQSEFIAQATSGDYDHLLRTCMEWVCVS